MAQQTGSIDLKATKEAHDEAEKVATNYVTDITNGIFVHPEDDTANGVQITDEVEVIRDNTSVAAFGENVRVGRESAYHLGLYSTGLRLEDGDENKYLDIFSSRSAAQDVTYDCGTASLLANGSTQLPLPTEIGGDLILHYTVEMTHQ